MRTRVVVAGSFDDLRSRHVRLLQEAARIGEVCVLLWSDESIRRLWGRAPTFPENERTYLLAALRFVSEVSVVDAAAGPEALAADGAAPAMWLAAGVDENTQHKAACAARGIAYHVIHEHELQGFPAPDDEPPAAGKKVIVTGCYDWLHSGHIRFFEEVSALGDLYVSLGSDANVRLLKGEGHPMFGQDERRYMVQAVRYVRQALVSSGFGWLDAEPQIEQIKPDIYAVNEDGDRPEKRAYCLEHDIAYVVLKRAPKDGLPRRQSTALRGF